MFFSGVGSVHPCIKIYISDLISVHTPEYSWVGLGKICTSHRCHQKSDFGEGLVPKLVEIFLFIKSGGYNRANIEWSVQPFNV